MLSVPLPVAETVPLLIVSLPCQTEIPFPLLLSATIFALLMFIAPLLEKRAFPVPILAVISPPVIVIVGDTIAP